MREGDNEKIAEDIPRFLADNKIASVSQLENFLTQTDEDSTLLQEQLVKFNSWIKEQIPHPASPSKPLNNSNHCALMPLDQPSSPSHHQPKQFTEVQEKIHHEMAASFNAVHHHHPSFHNNNQAWLTHHQQPIPTNLEHQHHQLQPVEAPDSVHPNQIYPPMSSFGYHNGHANGYHETHFDQHTHHDNSVRYDATYNQHPR